MKRFLLLLTVVLLIIYVFAHEYILIAHKFRLSKGDSLEVHLFVADGFNVELERPVQKGITRKFELITQNGNADLLAGREDAALPVVNRPVDFDGLGLLHMERDYAYITLENKT